ncbi:MAG: hypothetical protein H6Q31_3071, partial [Bacteroidetes bacterium]|nr:hypothetical protein [Bacteroidota bacterium]
MHTSLLRLSFLFLFPSAVLLAQSKFLYGMYAIGWGENE